MRELVHLRGNAWRSLWRSFAGVVAALSAAFALLRGAPDSTLDVRIKEALARAADFLCVQQNADGTWRSATYGSMRDGESLTPHVATVAFFLQAYRPEAAEAYWRARKYLVALASQRESGRFDVYTAAEASWAIGLGGSDPARDRWLDYLRGWRLDRKNGWSPDDLEFGGWGYWKGPPRKRIGAASDLLASNLSATLFALGALHIAGTPPAAPDREEILSFVKRCQNLPGDGGFFFSPSDPARNKAGETESGFASYGSMTCDGIRALIRCGLPRDHPRVQAASDWLARNFAVTRNPGDFSPEREAIRDSYFYYYAWSLAHAMRALRCDVVRTPDGPRVWSRELAEELLKRQGKDGAWRNSFTDAKEDDPLVSTPFAVAALILCRESFSAMQDGKQR